jgi:hypothetical protein
MNSRWRKLIVLLVFLGLPLQAVAATIHALSCLSDGQHAAQPHDHGPGSPHDHGGDNANSDSPHFCCNLVASGMLVVPTEAVQAGPPTLQSFFPVLATLFIPEQPRRPPRS